MNSRGVFLVAIICLARSASGTESWDESRRNGAIARQQGHYLEAKRYLETALAQFPYDAQDVRRADLDDELASVYELLGDVSATERLYQDAMRIIEKHTDDAPGVQAIVMGDFGAFRSIQGRFNEAGTLLEAALEKCRQTFGEGDVKTATMKSSLGQLYLLKGRLADAEQLLREAIEIERTVLPAYHLDRIGAESGLGYVYTLQGRYDKAEPILEQVSQNARQLGDMHPALAFALSNLADLYRVEGKPARSEPLLKRTLAIYETALGPESLKVGETLMDMSIDSITEKKYALAEEDLDRALRIFRRTSGPDSANVAVAEYRLATAYMNQGKHAEAESLLRHSLAIAEKTWPDGHSVVAACLYEMAEAERSQRHYADAELLYQKSIAMYEKFGPVGSLGLTVALKQYASLLKTGRGDEAKALEKRAQEMQKSIHGFR